VDALTRPKVGAPPAPVTAAAEPVGRGSWLLPICVGLAALSLLLPAALSFDPWAWLVWGREIAGLDLDTTGGPSWKPLPVLLTTVLAPLGAAAPALFLLAMRASALLAVVGVHRLATRFAGRVAGLVAVALLVLTPDGDPRFLRLVGEGHVAPLGAACAVWAVVSHLDGRHGRALACSWGLALLRPEAWPFVIAHAIWLRRRSALGQPMLLAAVLSIPILWFAGDWWGAGDPLQGAAAAQVLADVSPVDRLLDALRVAGAMVPLPAWVAALVAVAAARSRRSATEQWLAALAVAWSVLVIAMAALLGYAALSRFFLPAAAVVCVLAGIGAVQVATLARPPRGAGVTVLAVLVALGSLALVAPRVVGLGPVLAEVAHRSDAEADLDRVMARAGGRGALTACGAVAVEGRGLLRTAVAWKLELPLHAVGLDLRDIVVDAPPLPAGNEPSGTMLLRTGGRRDRLVGASDAAVELARGAEWVAYAVRCPEALPST
jgi:hypothetical protein